jgi:hypothetical protein
MTSPCLPKSARLHPPVLPVPVLLFAGIAATVGVTCANPESAVPAPVTAAAFSHLLDQPPFRRSLSLSESMVLSGVAVLPDGPMVTLWNRRTGESFVVGTLPNPQGWKLLELTQSTDLRSVAAVISAAGQELSLRFDPERLTPPKLDNTSRPGARPESQIVVEALLRSLDPEAAKSFEALPPSGQESFRKSFAGFLETYPASGDGERRTFVQRSLTEAAEAAAATEEESKPAPVSASDPAPAPAAEAEAATDPPPAASN